MPFWSASPLAGPSAAPVALGPQAMVSLLGGGFLAVGLIIIGVMVLIVVSSARFRSRAVAATGTIVGRQLASSGSSGYNSTGPAYYSIVEYTAQDGTPVRGRSRVASNPPAGKIGAVVPVFYDPARPSRVAIDSDRTRLMNGCGVAIASVVAAMFLLFGAIVLDIGLHS